MIFLWEHTLLLMMAIYMKAGDILVKIPRAIGKSGDITGGLPRVTEFLKPVTPAILLRFLKLMVWFLSGKN